MTSLFPATGGFHTSLSIQGLELHLGNLVTRWLFACGSPATRKVYALTIKEMLGFLAFHFSPVTLEALVQGGALAYATLVRERTSPLHPREKRLSQATAAKKICAVVSLLEQARKEGLIARNPLDTLARPKVKKETRACVLTDEEVRTLLRLLETERSDAEKGSVSKRRAAQNNEVAFRTLLAVGMRVGELVLLRAEDIELLPHAARIHMRAKGDEMHSPLVPVEVGERLLRLVQGNSSAGNFLFSPSDERNSVVQRLTRELARLCAKAGFTKKVTPHVLRATVATSLHNRGVPVGHIQKLMNHKDISTTAIYIRKAEEEKESAAFKILWES